MKQFIAREESWLEGQAAFINSVDQEVINSRLLMLKDLCWMLEKMFWPICRACRR